jgi:hypothetical protein
MELNQTGILFSSLVGSKVTESIPRFTAIQNELLKRVLPPIPFLPKTNNEAVRDVTADFNADVWQADKPLSEEQQFFPFSFVGEDGTRYLLPYEPMVNVIGKNTIVRRNVAKAQNMIGSIKERWNQADYEITITGVLIGSILSGTVDQCFPREDFERLRDQMTAPRSLTVYCEPLQLLGINQIVIEDFSFPFTKGENVQAYEIKAYSDFAYNLLLDIND